MSKHSFAMFPLLAMAVVICNSQAENQAPPCKQSPNVILIAIDTLRADHLGCYGYSRPVSPHIDALAAEGVRFERCYSTAAWTLPSFMSIFTGLMPAVHGCTSSGCAPLSHSIPTLPEQFKACGYFCGAVVCNPYVSGRYGFCRGFDIYDDYSVFLEAGVEGFADTLFEENRGFKTVVTGNIVTSQAKHLLERAQKSGRPFFLFILYYDPHNDYVPPAPYDRIYDPEYRGLFYGHDMDQFIHSPPADRDLQHLIARYDGEISYEDAQIGELLQKVNEISDPNFTLTILVSDHGEAFAEHGKMLHGNHAYREEVWVPMIWRWPGILPPGHRVRSPVSTLDIAKTFQELMRFEKLDLLQGETLWPGLWGGQPTQNRLVFSQEKGQYTITRDTLRYHMKGKNEELYDLRKDPWEQSNLLPSARPQLLVSLQEAMAKFSSECTEIHTLYHKNVAPTPVHLTPEEIRRLKSLGYVGK